MKTAKRLTIAAACLLACGMVWAAPETKPSTAPAAAPAAAAAPTTAPAPKAEPTSKPAPAPAPAAAPAAGPSTAPASQPANGHARASASGKIVIRFQFDGIDFNDLIRLFTQNASKPILGEFDVPGKLTFFDNEPYSYSEAFDTINILLAMRGFWLVEDARYFRVVKLTAIPNESPILTGVAEMEGFRPGEVVTVVLPLKYLDPGTASKAVVRMVSTWGSISPLVKGKGLVVTDSAGNIRRIQQFLKLLDTGSIMEKQIKAIPLRRASARVVTGIINDSFGGTSRRKMVYNATTGRYDYEAVDSEESFSATADDRTNSVVLMGAGEKLTMAEQVIKELDKESEETAEDIRIFKLKNVKAEEVAKTLREIMAEAGPAPAAGTGGPGAGGFAWRRPSATGSGGVSISAGKTKIVADTAGNRLIVSATTEEMAAIEKLIKELDGDAVASGTARIFRLKSADAQSLAGIITRATTSTDPRSGRAAAAIQVSADTRTNSLVVTGPSGDIQMAASLIEELDKDTAVDPREIHVVQLQAGDARQIAVSLAKLFAKEVAAGPGGHGTASSSLRVEADAVTNSLMIAATPGDWPVVQKILDQLKASVMPMATASTRRYPLKAAKAEELAETLRQIYGGSRNGRQGAPQAVRTSGPAAVPVIIAAHKDVNCLLVSAAEDEQKAIAELVNALDVPSSEKIDPIRLVKLTSAEAVRLAATLKSMQPAPVKGEPLDVLIEAEPLTNSLLIRAPEAKWKTLEEMIGKLDAATKSQVREMRIIVLSHTSAAGLAGMLGELYSGASQSAAGAMPRGPRPAGASAGGAAIVEERIVITPAPGDRALVIDAPKARIDEIAQLVQQLDSKESPGALQTRTYDLTTANAIDTAVSLERLFAQQRAGIVAAGGSRGAAASNEPQPRFEANAASNQLLVAATSAQFVEIDKLIASIQAGTKAAGETRTFRLKYVKASELVDVLATMLSDEAPSTTPGANRRPAGAGAPGAARAGATAQTATIRVAAVPEANAVVIQGPPTKLALAEKLIAGFDTADVATAGKIIVRTYQMTTSKAGDVAVSLAGLFSEAKSGTAGRAGAAAGEPQPRFDADAATNQLLVAATASQFAEIDKVIKDLQAGTVLASQTRTFVLKHAHASDVADVLATMLSEAATAPRRSPAGRAPAAAAAQESLCRVSFMDGSNTVVVQAPPDKLLLAEGLIKTFDVPEAGGKTVLEVVKLSNAQAASLAEAVTSALAARAARASAGKPAASDDQVTVTAEVNSNSVLVRGPARDVPEVVEMIRRLDTQGTSSAAQVRIFKLENSSAVDMEKSVGKLFKDIVAQATQRTKTGTPATPPPFSVVADERTNSLVVSTTSAHFAIVESLLASLDKAGPLRDVQYIFLEKANAGEVVTKLNAMFVDRKGDAKPNIEPDDISNSISIVAKEMDMKAMESVIAKLEKAAEWDDRPIVRVIPLQKIRANQMADVIQRVYGQMTDVPINVTDKLPEQPLLPADPNGQVMLPSILPMDSAPLLMPSGSGGRGSGKAPAPAPAPKPISMAKPKETQPSSRPSSQPTSQPARGGGITIAVDRTSNSLIVLAKRDQLGNIQAIIDQLAVNAQQADAEIRVFKIKQADCTSIASTLDSLFNPRVVAVPAAGGRGQEPAAIPEPKVNVVPDPRTKSLIVRTKPAEFELIVPLIAQLDTVATVISEVRVFVLKNTDAVEVAENLKDIFQLAAQGNQAQPQPGQPAAQPQQTGRRSGNRARADAVRQMLEMRGAGGVTQVDPATAISISANKNTNSVIASAPADAMKLVEKIIEELDQATAMAQAVRLYPLKHAEVATTVNALRDVFASSGAPSASAANGSRAPRSALRGASGVGREAPVVITGDEAARLVIVSAPSDKHELIEKVIGEIDSAQSAGEVAVKVYRLLNAQAATAAAALSQAMTGAGGGAAGGRGGRTGGGDAQVRISADTSSNCIVVKAGKEDHAKIAALLVEIDAAPADKFPVRTIALKHADAEELAGVLSRMFAGSQSAGGQRAGGRRGGAAPAGASAGATASVTGVAIEADRNASMLLVRADDATFEKVKQLVATLDVAGAASTVREIIALKSAKASDLAATLSAAFVSQRGGARGATATAEDTVVIVPEPISNSLIVTASAANLEKVKGLLAKLDTETGGGGKTEFLVLKNAQAGEMAGVLTQISGTRSGAPGPAGATGSRGSRQAARTPTVAAEGVIVTAETSSNAVVLTGPAGDVDKLLAVAKKLDEAAAASATAVVKLYGLKNAEVPTTVSALQEMFGSASARAGAGGARGGRGTSVRSGAEDVPVVIAGDEGARKVLVSAPEAKHVLIAKVIQEIDASQQAENVSVKVYRLENAQAPAAATALSQAMMGSGAAAAAGGRGGRGGSASGGQFRISADASSNCIVVRASKEDHEKITGLLKEMDIAQAERYPVRTLALKQAEADVVAETLNRLFGTAGGAAQATGGARGGRTAQAGGKGSVVIEPDRGARMLLVRCDEETFTRIKEVVSVLDVAGGGKAVPTVIALKHAQAGTIAPALQAAFAAQRGAKTKPEELVTVVAEPMSNSLLVTADGTNLEKVKGLLAQLDMPMAEGQGLVKVYRLENAQAASVATALSAAMNAGGGAAGVAGAGGARGPRTGGAAAGAAGANFVIAADNTSNSLIVRADKDDHEKIAALLKEMDAAPSDKFPVRTIAMNSADATEVAAVLNRVFAAGGAAAAGKGGAGRPAGAGASAGKGSVVIEADRGSRMLLVRCDEETFAKVKELAAKMDTTTAGVASQTLIALAHADAMAVATALTQAFAPQRGQRTQPEDMVGVVAETNSNSVIVTANAANLAKVKDLLTKLDTDTSGARTELLVLKHAKAADLGPVLSQVAGGGAGAGAARGPGKPAAAQAVTVSADAGSNALVFTGPSAKVDQLMAMAVKLDTASADTAVPVVKMYEVKNADVQIIATSLEQIFGTGVASAARTAPRATGARTQETPVIILPDDAGRKVVVSAPADKHELIAKVIKDMDEGQTGDPVIVKVYHVENSDSTTVAAALTTALQGGSGKAASASSSQVRITADRGSNSLVVRAPQSEQTRIAKLVTEMDMSPADQFPVKMIPLTNADATNVAAVLNRTFVTGSAGAAGGARKPGAAATGKPSVVIEADRDSRLLLVRADEPTFEKIREMAAKLDATNPAGRAARTLLALKHANAESVTAALNSAFLPPKGARVEPEDLVAVVADPATNSVLVTANVPNLEKVKALLAQLDAPTAAERTELLLLKNAKAVDLAKTLTTIAATAKSVGGAGKPGTAKGATLSADSSSNALIVTGPREEVDKVMQMALQLDKAAESAISSVEVIALKNGDAYSVATMVRDLYTQQANAAKANQQAIGALAVTADDRANALIVAASKDMHETVAKWVAQIEEMKPARGTMRLLQLKNVDPLEVERAIQQIYNSTSGGARGPEGVLAPPGATPRRPATPAATPARSGTAARPTATNSTGRVQTSVLDAQRSILINASDEDFEAIKALAEVLDQAAAATKQTVQIFVLKKADNKRVAAALTSMYRPVAGRAARPEDQVIVTALEQTNAVVASAAKEKLAEVAHLIEQLDKEEVAPSLQFKIFPLTNAQPTKVMPALQQMLAQIRKLRPDDTIDVQADERTKSIIVTAKSTLFEEIGKIVTALDKPAAHASVDVLIVPLKKADAPRLAEVLTEMLRPSKAGQVTPEAMALQEHVRLLKVRGLQENIAELDLTQPIKIAADPVVSRQQGSNSLVITSTPNNLRAMQAIVEMLDTMPLADDVRVKVMQLKNADAASVATILKDVFTQGKQLAGHPKGSVAGAAEPKTVTGKALVSVLNVSADGRTNTLVISGCEESICLAELIVRDLDKSEGKIVTEVRLFKLKHGDAVKLLPLLQAVFAEGAAVPGMEGLQSQVSRLQTVLKDKDGKETKLPKTRAALILQADSSTNIIIAAARSDVMPLLADVVASIDVPGAGSLSTIRFVPFEHADASSIQSIINSLHTGPNAALIRAEDKPVLTYDSRTNALIISSSPKTWEVLEPLMKRLDANTSVSGEDVRIIPLKSADATALGTALQRIMDSRVSRYTTQGAVIIDTIRMTIVPDPRTNSLIVGGRDEGFKQVKALAEQLDGASPTLAGQIQLLPLKEANAGAIATSLTSFFTARYAVSVTPDVARQKPIIMADVRTNSLLMAANADDTKIIKSLLERLDTKLTDPAVQLQVVSLKKNSSTVVGPMIQQIFTARLTSMTAPGATAAPQDRVDIAADALSNALIISASKENHALIRELLAKVDIEPTSETGSVRMFYLKNSDAQRVATMIQSLLSQGLYKPGLLAATTPALAAREKVSIVVDTRTNVLVVSASKENFAVVAEVIEKLDSSADYSLLGDLRVYELKRASATELAPTLQRLFDAKKAAETATGGSGRSLAVSIIPDARTNTLLVAGSRESFAAMDSMIGKLDGSQVVSATTFKVFTLKNGTAALLQPTLDKLFLARITRGATKDAVTIIADPHANSLIVGASPTDMEVAAALIEQLDKAQNVAGSAVQAFPLAKADAAQVAKTLQELYRSGATTTTPVSITVDERTNTIMVSAGPSDAKRIGELIAQLDRSELTSVTEIRVYPLENADATELAKILTDTLTTKPKSPTLVSANRQTLLQFVSQTKDGKEMIERALQEGVLITPDVRTNSLIISAPIKSISLLESLVKSLDSTSPRAAEIRVFALTNSDCRQMSDVLTQLFRLKAAGTSGGATGAGGTSGARAVNYTLVSTQPALNGAAATLGMADQDSLSVTVDIRTNSLLVGGTTRLVDLAANVIETLDSCPAQERETKVYRLRNAQAGNIQTAMRSFLDQEKQRLSSVLGQQAVGSAFQILEREVAIVAEPNSNTLLLSASPRYFETIEAMIREMDLAPPQVLIQVLLAEVKLDDKTELGVDWNLVHKWDSGKKSVGYGTNFGVSAETAGFSLAVTAGDVEMFMRALQSQGKLEILSRPQILATDNQRANINVGQRVPFVTNSTVNQQGSVFNTIQYQDVGIILNVTPRINPDGFVKLQVNPEISSLSSSTVDISENAKAIIINKRSAETTVTVQDGHTIVIGGLITTTDEHREDKVPVLGDLPLIGPLFKTTTKTKERSELLIILTPHVLRTVAEADAVSDVQRKRVNTIRQLQREQVEDSLRKYLDKFMNGEEYQTDLRPTNQPAKSPTTKSALEEAKALMRVRSRMEPTTRPAMRLEYERKDPNQD